MDCGLVTQLRFTGPAPHRLTDACLAELGRALDALEKNPPPVLLILGGAGDFLAGADFNDILTITEANAPLKAMDYARAGQRLLGRLQRLASFTVAYIDGHCLGGGLDLILHCDARWVSPRALLGHPGIKRHFFTGWGGTALLPEFPGGAELLLSGEIIDGEAAMRIGLATQLLADEVAAQALAERLAPTLAAISPARRSLLKEGWLRSRRMAPRPAAALGRRLQELAEFE